jgi:hypothetical protein
MLPSDAEELFMTKAQYEVFEARRRRPEQRLPMVRPERPCRQQERNVLNSQAPARLAPTGQTQGELA